MLNNFDCAELFPCVQQKKIRSVFDTVFSKLKNQLYKIFASDFSMLQTQLNPRFMGKAFLCRSFEDCSQPYLILCRFFYIFLYRFTARLGLGFNILFVQYCSVICRPLDHTVGRPQNGRSM